MTEVRHRCRWKVQRDAEGLVATSVCPGCEVIAGRADNYNDMNGEPRMTQRPERGEVTAREHGDHAYRRRGEIQGVALK
eukprot:870790-Amphidinium_carterae.1